LRLGGDGLFELLVFLDNRHRAADAGRQGAVEIVRGLDSSDVQQKKVADGDVHVDFADRADAWSGPPRVFLSGHCFGECDELLRGEPSVPLDIQHGNRLIAEPAKRASTEERRQNEASFSS